MGWSLKLLFVYQLQRFVVSWQILSDTKELQKEINNLTGKLDRTFAVTDELVFKVAQVFLRLCLVVSESDWMSTH